MDYYLNELSLCPVENVSDAHRVMRQFVSCCACLRHLGMNAIRLNSSLNDFELTENYFVYQWRTDSNVDKELIQRFRSIVSKSPIIEAENIPLFSNAQNGDMYVDKIRVMGLFAGYIDKSVSLSLTTRTLWYQSFVQAKYIYLNSKGIQEELVQIHNVSNL